VTLNKLDFKIL